MLNVYYSKYNLKFRYWFANRNHWYDRGNEAEDANLQTRWSINCSGAFPDNIKVANFIFYKSKFTCAITTHYLGQHNVTVHF